MKQQTEPNSLAPGDARTDVVRTAPAARTVGSILVVAFLFLSGLTTTVVMAQEKAQVDRTELPIKAPWYPPITTLDARDAKAPPVFEVEAPKDTPNVVVILLDDLGSGGMSSFGGVIETPHFDKLARAGLMSNQFHTTTL